MDHGTGAFTILIEKPDENKRLDTLIFDSIPDCSRSRAAGLIRSGFIRVHGHEKKAGYRVRTGDVIQGCIPEPVPAVYTPEPIPLDILYEDRELVVINKQPGLVVHPAPGHPGGTLVNALLHHCPTLEAIGGEFRPGIVHRLDKDTSGTMVVAKNASAMVHLAAQFKAREVEKTYLALVHPGMKEACGTISLPIGRHPVDRKRMSTVSRKGRSALTDWYVQETFPGAALVKVKIRTGRTHQIRVHFAAIHHPIMGDRVYGGRRLEKSKEIPESLKMLLKSVDRQMLHAWRLRLVHPGTGRPMTFESTMARDMATIIDALRG